MYKICMICTKTIGVRLVYDLLLYKYLGEDSFRLGPKREFIVHMNDIQPSIFYIHRSSTYIHQSSTYIRLPRAMCGRCMYDRRCVQFFKNAVTHIDGLRPKGKAAREARPDVAPALHPDSFI